MGSDNATVLHSPKVHRWHGTTWDACRRSSRCCRVGDNDIAFEVSYFLLRGVKDNEVFENANAADAALYVIVGTRRSSA